MPSYMLHNNLQERWAGRRLAFYQIRFDAAHEMDRLVPGVEELLRGHQILSYAAYETLGDYDLFIRCWIPVALDHRDLAEELESDPRLHIKRAIAILGHRVVYHWPWMNDDYSTYRRPDEASYYKPLPYLVALNRTLADEPDGLSDAQIDQAKEESIIAPIGPSTIEHRDDIKFVVTLSTIDTDSGLRAERVIEGISDAFGDLARLASRSGPNALISQLSLYETGNENASFIVLGRLDGSRYYEALELLFATLTLTGFKRYFDIRPTTYLTVSSGFSMFCEEIPLELSEARSDQIDGPLDVARLLSRPEGMSLEFKASFYVQIRNWLLDGTYDASEELFVSGIVREVAAFLNSPPGGVLVVGVLEWERELQKLPRQSLEHAEAQIGSLPHLGDLAVTGIEMDKIAKGVFSDLDRAERHIIEKLETNLTVSIAGLVEVTFHDLSERTVAVLRVEALRAGQFAYLKTDDSKLFVRSGGSTRSLTGSDADNYRARRG